ncbi:MAG TPA: alpha/beta hydrolase [Ohtaekwangia sp.]
MSKIFFRVRGEGIPVILVHGFPMNHSVWDEFSVKLSQNFKVYTPDLPGFGKSELHSSLTIDSVAGELINWLVEEGLSKCVLIGHSLGGYVSLAMVEKAPELFSGLGLFHSTSYADSLEKKESRTKTVEFIRKNGVLAFTANFIPPLFADQNHPAISSVRDITIQSTEETVIAYTLAMRDRPDRQGILKQFQNPVLLLGGEKDPGISPESLSSQAQICRIPDLHILPEVAHMGMFEKATETGDIIRSFINRCQSTL